MMLGIPGITDVLGQYRTLQWLDGLSGFMDEREAGTTSVIGFGNARHLTNLGRAAKKGDGRGVFVAVIPEIPKKEGPTPDVPETPTIPTGPTTGPVPGPAPLGPPSIITVDWGTLPDLTGHMTHDNVEGHMTHDYVQGHLTVDEVTGNPMEHTVPLAFVYDILARDDAWHWKENIMILATMYKNDPEIARYAMRSLAELMPKHGNNNQASAGVTQEYGEIILEGLRKYETDGESASRDYLGNAFVDLNIENIGETVDGYIERFGSLRGGL
jgi:hypothetical protein